MPFIDFGAFVVTNAVANAPDQPTPPIALAGFNSLHVQVICGAINSVGGSALLEAIPQISNDNASWQNIGGFGTTAALILFGTTTPLLPAPGVQQATVGPDAPIPPSTAPTAYRVTLGAVYVRLLFRINLNGATSGNTTVRVLVNTFNG